VIEFVIDDEIKSHIPPLREEERRGLEELILQEGCRHPLIVWQGILLDGHNRFDICERNSIPYEVEEIDLPGREAAIAWIEDNQLGRRNVTADQFAYFIGRKYARQKKQGARTDLTSPQNEGRLSPTAERVAEQHGVSRATVERAASFASDVDAIADRIGHAARTELLSGSTGATRAEVADAAEAVKETGLHFANVEDVLKFAAGRKKDSPYSSVKFTGNQEWYTPAKYIALAREVMGSIDVDPASNAIAQETVQAATFYTVDDDGLTKEWRGRGWLNPPYNQPEISQFTDKLYCGTGSRSPYRSSHARQQCYRRGMVSASRPSRQLYLLHSRADSIPA
jgi:DNA N-6-adenine-methyltransferase (Dam)